MNFLVRLWLPALLLFFVSCNDDSDSIPLPIFPESTTLIEGQSVLKVLPLPQGWASLQETLQPQYLVTQPKRALIWRDAAFQEIARYQPAEGWSLIDAAAHPSGEVSVVIIQLDIQRTPFFDIRVLRMHTGQQLAEIKLEQLPGTGERTRYFPASLDRLRLEPFQEEVYLVARWDYNQVEASRLAYANNQFSIKWQKLVEPDAYAGSIGIIGGGYDNFHQGDRYFFVYAGVDAQGELFVGVPSHEEVLLSHDALHNDNLASEANPGAYDWGVAIVTKLSPSGQRVYSKLLGKSTQKRLINLRVGGGTIYLVGRIKTGSAPDSWDAWVLAADASSGQQRYEQPLHVQQGDMFWDIEPLANGHALAVGTKAYVQNPGGLSVSDQRLALAVELDGQGLIAGEVELPQGPAERGSEAQFVKILNNRQVLFAGAHNAPGTHAPVFSDGFIALRNLPDIN
ncbi:MAG: hypothetical protein ACOYXA_15210 [Bacteroidota bacterium]